MISLIIMVIIEVTFFATLIFFQGAFYGKDKEDMIIDSPCKDCEERIVGCHSSCVSYVDYQAKIKQLHDHEKEERRKQNRRRRINNKP